MRGRLRSIAKVAVILFSMGGTQLLAEVPGADISRVFASAKHGAPLRCVALGGSITQAGQGWIGPWLRENFPFGEIVMANAGMSATGSQLGIFRIGRDVIAWQPDLVLIEFCVNDGGLEDEKAIRYVESIVVRLKQLPHPPAIVMIEAADKNGVNLQRHRQVARHYGLLEVDLQKAVEEFLKTTGKDWEYLFSDAVHPNERGHILYATTIAAALTPFLQREPAGGQPPLPKSLSKAPLMLDGEMVPFSSLVAEGWKSQNTLPFWWNRFFQGTLISEKPESVLRMPVQGTTFGVLFPMERGYGRGWVSVDGKESKELITNSRDGYDFLVAAEDLPAREHVLEIVPESNGKPLRLGYLLRSGQTGATSEPSGQGKLSAKMMSELVFSPIPAADWKWAGPYPVLDDGRDAARGFARPFPPETPASVAWQDMSKLNSGWLRFPLAGNRPSVVYAETILESPTEEKVILAFSADYFAKFRVNDKLLTSWEAGHGSPQERHFFPITLPAGKNHIRIKLGSGSLGFGFALEIGRAGNAEKS